MVQKTINIKTKVSLRSNIMVSDLDAYCLKGYRPFNIRSLKIEIKRFGTKTKKLKYKDLKLTLLYNNIVKPVKKEDQKDKKKN